MSDNGKCCYCGKTPDEDGYGECVICSPNGAEVMDKLRGRYLLLDKKDIINMIRGHNPWDYFDKGYGHLMESEGNQHNHSFKWGTDVFEKMSIEQLVSIHMCLKFNFDASEKPRQSVVAVEGDGDYYYDEESVFLEGLERDINKGE